MSHGMKVEHTPRRLECLDVRFPADLPIPSEGVAYFRVSPEMRDFLTLCDKRFGVIGFEYTFGTLNIGVICAKRTNQ